jgi:hypothetical protein
MSGHSDRLIGWKEIYVAAAKLDACLRNNSDFTVGTRERVLLFLLPKLAG